MGDTSTDDSKLWFQIQHRQDCVIVTVGGEVDIETAASLGPAMEAAAGRSSRVIVDLSDVSFIDSTGLGVLIGARNRAHEQGGSVALVHPPHLVRRLLTSTSLQSILPVYESVDEALPPN